MKNLYQLADGTHVDTAPRRVVKETKPRTIGSDTGGKHNYQEDTDAYAMHLLLIALHTYLSISYTRITMHIANNNTVARIAAVVAGLGLVAMSFATFTPAVKAQTATDLQAQITALLAQIAALQGGSTATASVTFTRDLTIGSSGADVTALQNWLISKGHTIAAGATGYFGAQTQAALAAYQAANGISPAAGYFGPVTRAKVNATAGTGGTGTGTGTSTGDLKGGEASLEDLTIRDGEDDEVEEGGTAQIAEIEFDVEDGDIRIDRVDLKLVQTGGATVSEDEPWEAFETISLLDEEGDELASEDVSDEDDWLDEDDGTFRFTGLDYVVREGETAVIIVEVEAADGVLNSADTDTWTLTVEDEAIRGVDSEGIQQYLADTDSVAFDLVEEGSDDELTVRSSSEDPDSTTLQVEDDGTSDWYTVFTFELEADEDSNDVEVDSIQVDFDTGVDDTDDAEDVINDVKLVIDGDEFDDYTMNDISTEIASTTFDIDGDLTVEAGDTVVVEVMVEFKDSTDFGGTGTIQASVDGDNIEAEGADDITVGGSATGENHSLVAAGISVDNNDKADFVDNSVEVDGNDNDYAEFEVVVDITAFEEDAFISSTSSAFTYQIEGTNGSATTTATQSVSATVDSDADLDSNGFYRVDEGSTESFTFRVVFTPASTGSYDYRMQLLTIKFDDATSQSAMTWTASPASDYETGFAFIAN